VSDMTPEERAARREYIDGIRVVMDLERLGELIGAVAVRFASLRGIEPPDFDGEEMRDLAVTGWKHVQHMADRADFAKSVHSGLENIDEAAAELLAPKPQHQSEFGL
jgi:hypothetical protein